MMMVIEEYQRMNPNRDTPFQLKRKIPIYEFSDEGRGWTLKEPLKEAQRVLLCPASSEFETNLLALWGRNKESPQNIIGYAILAPHREVCGGVKHSKCQPGIQK